jgi:hypothetical protein
MNFDSVAASGEPNGAWGEGRTAPAGRAGGLYASDATPVRIVDGKEDHMEDRGEFGVDLYWIPLGAGGWFVRMNGRMYEAVQALIERRRALDLYHTALVVQVPEGRFVIENAWPIPDADGRSRGVVVEGPVWSRPVARFRFLRYEVRRWQDGVIPDAREAVGGPQRVCHDQRVARRCLDLVDSVPAMVWGRDEVGAGEMWNSNSVISWLLARSGITTEALRPPPGGRAPGWQAGLAVARRRPPKRGLLVGALPRVPQR